MSHMPYTPHKSQMSHLPHLHHAATSPPNTPIQALKFKHLIVSFTRTSPGNANDMKSESASESESESESAMIRLVKVKGE
jgi:hypothetical protein